LDELFEILTWNQLSIHDKKVFILNSGGFYDHLLAHLQKLTDEGFLYGELPEQFTILNEPKDILQHLQ
jgi:predicted Rossmann-fold nucleotide-binding protein